MERNQDLIDQGLQCPYCLGKTKFIDSSKVYGTSYGMIYICWKCKAWVGVHKSNCKALGRLADDKLRTLKRQAHLYFDDLWKRKMEQGFSKHMARTMAYKWLSGKMDLPEERTHIGLFDEDQCQKVIDFCKKYKKGNA